MGYGQYSEGGGGRTYHNDEARDNESGARTKTVFDNRMVAHVWAQNVQSFGRSNNGQFFFDGPTLYSYGRHFVVGHIMPDGTALLNSDKYSITTTRHQSYAWVAVRGEYRHIPGLTKLLPDLLRGRESDYSRKAVIRHIREHMIGGDSESAALYLLEAIGDKSPARTLARICKDAETRARKEAEQAEKTRKLCLTGKARRLAAMGETEIREWLHKYGTIDSLADFAKEARAMLKALPANQRNRRAIVQFAIREATALLKRLRATRARHEANKALRADIKCIRANLREMGGSMAHCVRFEYLASAAESVATHGRALGGLKRESFLALAREAMARHRAQVERENQERFEREAAARVSWLNGGPGRGYGRLSDERGGALIRAMGVERDESGAIVAGTLQTSHGAEVPLTHAIRAFRFLKLCRETGRTWYANGTTIRVGHFRIDRVDASGDFKAGCHTIHWGEVERLARALGIFDASPDDSALVPSNHAA